METTKYYDKNRNLIEAGMVIKHDDGDVQRVYATEDGDLGLNASNENHVSFNEYNRQLYALYQFDMSEWEIVKDSE